MPTAVRAAPMPSPMAVATARICSSSERAASNTARMMQATTGPPKDSPQPSMAASTTSITMARMPRACRDLPVTPRRLFRRLSIKDMARPTSTTGCGTRRHNMSGSPTSQSIARAPRRTAARAARTATVASRMGSQSIIVGIIQLWSLACNSIRGLALLSFQGRWTWRQDENDPGAVDPVRAPIPGLGPET